MFRDLKAEEIEARVSRVYESGVELLLFKNARCDARILDEQVGPDNWECDFYECKGTLFCNVKIRVKHGEDDYEWVWKSDAGAPSNMESVKGEASDAFKRACFKWGIGRELYTAPRIWVPSDKCAIKQSNRGKLVCYDNFVVSKIGIEDGRITGVRIDNTSRGCTCFSWREA